MSGTLPRANFDIAIEQRYHSADILVIFCWKRFNSHKTHWKWIRRIARKTFNFSNLRSSSTTIFLLKLKLIVLIYLSNLKKLYNSQKIKESPHNVDFTRFLDKICAFLVASLTLLSILAVTVVISASSFIGRSALKFRLSLGFYASRYRAVKIDRGYMQDLSSIARSCTYVYKVESFRWKYAREPVRNRESLRSWNSMKSSFRLHRLVRRATPPSTLEHPSLSLRSLPSVLSTLAILIHQRDCATSVITLCLYRETWRTRGGRNLILCAIIHCVFSTCNV